ncbi:MAG: phycobiliprotein lyase [Spirulina sp. DLM2.Bin59]|nr:MAG: phycobiliprotein lyase [Spirulina sp. DLM2.Bin59]
MPTTPQAFLLPAVQQITAFFEATAGNWHSQRRYYTLASGETQEVESEIAIAFLAPGAPELVHLAGLHDLPDPEAIVCGAQVTWESTYPQQNRKPVKGSTVFGVAGEKLLRDRGFATSKPVTAAYHFPEPKTLCLRTSYNGSSFEEEIKLIGSQYRTRQTIIGRAGEEVMIGQYLETRLG